MRTMSFCYVEPGNLSPALAKKRRAVHANSRSFLGLETLNHRPQDGSGHITDADPHQRSTQSKNQGAQHRSPASPTAAAQDASQTASNHTKANCHIDNDLSRFAK